MIKNATEREQIRLSLLRYAAEADRLGLKVGLLHQSVRCEGFSNLDVKDVETELLYLMDKGLVATVGQIISPELTRWRATAEGRDYLAQQGVV